MNTWLIKGFFDTVPKELDESAKVDGASHATVFRRIILPLVIPILVVVGLLGFIGAINEFLIASVFLTAEHDARHSRSACTRWSPVNGTPTSACSPPGPF